MPFRDYYTRGHTNPEYELLEVGGGGGLTSDSEIPKFQSTYTPSQNIYVNSKEHKGHYCPNGRVGGVNGIEKSKFIMTFWKGRQNVKVNITDWMHIYGISAVCRSHYLK